MTAWNTRNRAVWGCTFTFAFLSRSVRPGADWIFGTILGHRVAVLFGDLIRSCVSMAVTWLGFCGKESLSMYTSRNKRPRKKTKKDTLQSKIQPVKASWWPLFSFSPRLEIEAGRSGGQRRAIVVQCRARIEHCASPELNGYKAARAQALSASQVNFVSWGSIVDQNEWARKACLENN